MKRSLDNNLLLKYTAEFKSKSMEESFLRSTWKEHKTVTRNTLLVLVFFDVAFFIRDILEARNSEVIHSLFLLRLVVFCIIFCSIVYIHRADTYFSRYHHLLLLNQIVISIAIFLLAIIRDMPVAYLGVNTILLTLIFYQFINNRFYYTVSACGLIGSGSVLTSILFLNMNLSDLAASILFLVPLNFLGIIILRSIKRTRRNEFLALSDLRKASDEKEKAIRELRGTLAEIKTLRGFLPICAKCKKIRDDEGYWNQIESYIEKHSDVQFSHGICQECAKELYGDTKWYKKITKDDKTSA